MTIERTTDEIIIRLPSDIKFEAIQSFLNYIEYLELTKDSKATQTDADALARSAKKGWWEKNKDRFLPNL